MKLLTIAILLFLSIATYSQENKEKEETRANLNLEKMPSSETNDISVITFGELPGTVKNKLEELKIGKQAVESIKEIESEDGMVYGVSFYQNSKLKTIRIKENGQIENE